MDPKTSQTSNARKPSSGIALAVGLGLAILALSSVRLIGDLNSSAGHVAILQSAIPLPIWRTRLGLNIALFTLTLVAVHVALGVLCWGMAILTERGFPRARLTRPKWVLAWCLACTVWLLTANATYFPHSSLGEPYQHLMRETFLSLTPHALASAAMAAGIVVSLIAAARAQPRKALLAGAVFAVLGLATSGFSAVRPAAALPAVGPPNVIILGIDSLRADAIKQGNTPAIDEFMRSAARFEDAITPLARTFPSWVSILTGKHPHTTGAYMNLLPRKGIRTGDTLPQLLRDRGYRTIYAIDETRFSNLDATYGFEDTITPAIGASDFVLALCADTPLTNMLMNTRLGEVLFPHIHANRAAHFTYDPDAFVRRLERGLELDRPLMLAAHLTLAHYPFTWATSQAETGNDSLARGDYFEAVRRADRQFGDVLGMLERRGALRNALVIVLSDHGEAIGEKGDLLPAAFPEGDHPDNEFQRWGHGSSVFSPNQYRVVLGIRAYGAASSLLPNAGTVSAPVSLVDLAPTLLELLGEMPDADFDGSSLVPVLRGSAATSFFTDRIRYTETEYNPPGFTSEHASASAIAAAVGVYMLDPVTDRIEVRREKLDWIMANRQYAALLGDRAMGAAIPTHQRDGRFEFRYLPLTGSGSADEGIRLRAALSERYQIEFAGSGNLPALSR